MNPLTSGRTRRISPQRALVLDLLHFAKGLPIVPCDRQFCCAELADLRANVRPRISWPALFLRAYGIVSAETPLLRTSYLRWPWPRFYEHAAAVGMISVQRTHNDEDRLCWGRFIQPELQTLPEIQAALDDYQRQPVAEAFKSQVQLSQLPGPLRRLIWWTNLNLLPRKRAKRVGTFGMSVLAGQGAFNRQHPSFLTTSLSYGPLDERGRMLVTLLYDHRVFDGSTAAAALERLEETLQGEIARELRGLTSRTRAA
jgi:hypothetical protein